MSSPQIGTPLTFSLFLLSAALYFAAASSEAPGSKEGGGSAALENEARKEGSGKPVGEKKRESCFKSSTR
jgi:hypothetical protein